MVLHNFFFHKSNIILIIFDKFLNILKLFIFHILDFAIRYIYEFSSKINGKGRFYKIN